MNKQYVVHSQKMAGWLMLRGNKLITVADNKRHPGYHIYVFNDTDKLRNDMADYTLRGKVL